VVYRIAEEWLGTWWALLISALLFGLIHLSSAGATIFSALSVAFQAGIVLAAVYALTHRLWMALGLHMAWDFANDGIFGVGVAGQSGQSLHGLLQATLNGPKLLTGGALGIEASIITLVVMLIAGIMMLRVAYQKGQFIFHKNRSGRESAHSTAGKISLWICDKPYFFAFGLPLVVGAVAYGFAYLFSLAKFDPSPFSVPVTACLTACPKRVEHAKLYFLYLFVRTAALRRASPVGWNSYCK
jgi:hypothetical protein